MIQLWSVPIKIILVALTLLLLQSCTVFRTNLDHNCVNIFSKKYTPSNESLFVLPWKVNKSYPLTQGNCTFESHSLSNNQHMSFDFKMPIGTPVTAIAKGRVAAVVEEFKDNIDNEYHQANFIGIEHQDGIISWYMHLKHNGALVKVDDFVEQGDVIGLSGNTGDSAYPHLHLFAQQLIEACFDAKNHSADLDKCPHIPLSFKNISPNDTVLKEFVTYKALPY